MCWHLGRRGRPLSSRGPFHSRHCVNPSALGDDFRLDEEAAQAGPSSTLEEDVGMDAEAMVDSMSTTLPDEDLLGNAEV